MKTTANTIPTAADLGFPSVADQIATILQEVDICLARNIVFSAMSLNPENIYKMTDLAVALTAVMNQEKARANAEKSAQKIVEDAFSSFQQKVK